MKTKELHFNEPPNSPPNDQHQMGEPPNEPPNGPPNDAHQMSEPPNDPASVPKQIDT